MRPERSSACGQYSKAQGLQCYTDSQLNSSLHQDGDESSVYYAAQAMHQLQRTMGTVPRLVGKGDVSQVRLMWPPDFPRALAAIS